MYVFCFLFVCFIFLAGGGQEIIGSFIGFMDKGGIILVSSLLCSRIKYGHSREK